MTKQRTKSGGRTKGTPNKITVELKEKITEFLDKELQNIDTYFKSVTSSQKLEFMTRLLPYVVPKQTEAINNQEQENLQPIRIINLGNGINPNLKTDGNSN